MFANFEELSVITSERLLTIDEAREACKLYNGLTDENQKKPIKEAINATILSESDNARKNAIAEKIAMFEDNPVTFWQSYLASPTYIAPTLKVSAKDGLSIVDRSIKLLFSAIERQYQLNHSIEQDNHGKAKPNKGVSMFADIHTTGLIYVLNGNIALNVCKEFSASDPRVRSESVQNVLKDLDVPTIEVKHNKKPSTFEQCFTISSMDALQKSADFIAKIAIPDGILPETCHLRKPEIRWFVSFYSSRTAVDRKTGKPRMLVKMPSDTSFIDVLVWAVSAKYNGQDVELAGTNGISMLDFTEKAAK